MADSSGDGLAASISAESAAPADVRFVSGREVDYGAFRAISTMIEEQADRRPERSAISYDGRTLTYRQLDHLVNGLAADLAHHGVGSGAILPVLLVNSLEDRKSVV